MTEVEKQRVRSAGDLEVFSPEEVLALVRAAASPQDAAIFLTAAFTGLRRGELLALRWRDVDFAGSVIRVRGSYSAGMLTSPKSGTVRSVPMAPDVARPLAELGQRLDWTGDDDLVFPGEGGDYLDGSALRRRYAAALERASLRQLRFHDLRYTFGTRMIARADIRRVQEWMGPADVQTTMRYLHYAPREEDAALVAEAFALPGADSASSEITRSPPRKMCRFAGRCPKMSRNVPVDCRDRRMQGFDPQQRRAISRLADIFGRLAQHVVRGVCVCCCQWNALR